MWVEYDDVFKEPLKVNEQGAVAVPQILPLGVESSNAFVAVRKSPALKVGVEGPWEEVDPAELPEALRHEGRRPVLLEGPLGDAVERPAHLRQPARTGLHESPKLSHGGLPPRTPLPPRPRASHP